MISEGDAAPLFSLPLAGGGRFVLGEAGRGAVLFFYPKADTSGCTKEALAFSAAAADFHAVDIEVIGISPDPLKAVEAFKAKHDLGVALGSDTERAAIEMYGVWAEKSMYGRAYMGVDRSTFLIDATGRVVKIWRGVKVPGHVEQVLTAARELAGSAAA